MKYKTGDQVVYRKRKVSPHPGPRAEGIRPSRAGDDYTYEVDKYWTVAEVHQDGTLELVTRGGKAHRVSIDDFHLRKASLYERLFLRSRFPTLHVVQQESHHAG